MITEYPIKIFLVIWQKKEYNTAMNGYKLVGHKITVIKIKKKIISMDVEA